MLLALGSAAAQQKRASVLDDRVVVRPRRVVIVRDRKWARDFPERKQAIVVYPVVTGTNLDEFSVGHKGITFLYDADFPHVMEEFEPRGMYFFTYAELRPYIKPEGLLGHFVR